MISASDLRRLNRRFGEEFGFNPHGQPNFRWSRTETLFRYVSHGEQYVRTPGGIFTLQKKYTPRCWAERYGKCWILTKWRHYTEDEWYGMVKGAMPYPKQGDWEPVETIRLGEEYPDHAVEPNLDETQQACAAIRAHRARLSSYHYDPHQNVLAREIELESERLQQSKVNSILSGIDSELRDLTPAFGNDPGTHGGPLEFMSGRKGKPHVNSSSAS
ncbi:MAG TPA: hypothetical protein VE958_11535 [Bryobacteraceae bacterium]|nr:hypothetical protein [Bryobacteraceae bacterium]